MTHRKCLLCQWWAGMPTLRCFCVFRLPEKLFTFCYRVGFPAHRQRR
ncbi:MAG: hypothetical protein IKX14_04940 [Neisseriaceae bacterium]|nr:hypothetical protein [Neisseriaceae bacterium]